MLLLQSKADVNATDRLGETALHSAAWSGHRETVEHLVRFNIDLNKTNLDGRTALHLAALQGHDELTDFLLESGASSRIPDADGLLACALAERANKDKDVLEVDIAKKLREHELTRQCHENIQMLQAL